MTSLLRHLLRLLRLARLPRPPPLSLIIDPARLRDPVGGGRRRRVVLGTARILVLRL